MDDADRASAAQDRLLTARLAARRQYQGTSAARCQDCGNDIPQRRQQSIPGVRYCTECQDWLELRGLA